MKIKNIYFLILVVLFTSCSESFLDQKNPNLATTDNFWNTEADLKAALASCYWGIGWSWGCYGPSCVIGYNSRVDNLTSTPNAGDPYSFSMFTNTSSTWSGWRYFTSHYVGIFNCNQVIQYGGDMGLSQDVKDKYIYEAYFLRGLFYLYLVNDFGSVPIHAKVPETEEEYNLERSPIEDVWQQVVDDFTKAAEGLPSTRPSDETGRATKGAALAYLGRAYLYQENWAKAQEVLKGVVDNESTYGYGLQPNFAELFDGEHENGPEAVFEIQITHVGGTEIWGDHNDRLQTTPAGWYFAPLEVGGLQFLTPTQKLLEDFLEEPTSDGNFDPRATATLAWDYPGNIFYTRDFQSFFDVNKVYLKKYENWWKVDENTPEFAVSELDEYGMRYADVLLMLAEAYTMQGNVSGAAPFVKRIRDRAKLANKDFSAYSQDQMMAEIRHQRELEFVREGTRWYDLRRWGMIENALQANNHPGKANYSSRYEYFPIPQDEINSNPNIIQNEAWR